MCRYTKFIDPAYAVIQSAIRFWMLWARSSACFTSAGDGAISLMRWVLTVCLPSATWLLRYASSPTALNGPV